MKDRAFDRPVRDMRLMFRALTDQSGSCGSIWPCLWDAYLTAMLADARLSECHDVREFLNAKRGAYEPESAGGGLGAVGPGECYSPHPRVAFKYRDEG